MANKFKRAGSGNSNADASWSTTSGGGADTTVPTAADDVFLDASSGDLTLNAAFVARSVNCTGYTGTITHNSSVTCTIGDATAGASSIALKLVSGMTYTPASQTTSQWVMASTSATVQSIDSGGKTMPLLTINGVGSSYALAANYTSGTGANLQLTNGTLDFNDFDLSLNAFASATDNVRTLTMGNGSITCRGTGTPWNCSTAQVNLTLNCEGSTVVISDTSSTAKIFTGGGKRYNRITFSGGTGSKRLNGSDTFNYLPQCPNGGGALTFAVGTTITVDNSIVEDFGNGTNALTIGTSSSGTGATLSKPGGIIAADYLTFNNNSAIPGTPVLTATGGATFYAGSHSTQASTNPGWVFEDAPVVISNGGDGAEITGPDAVMVCISGGDNTYTCKTS